MRAGYFLLGASLVACGGRVVLDRDGTAAGSTGGAGTSSSSSSGSQGGSAGTSSSSVSQGTGGACTGPIYAGKWDDAPAAWSNLPANGGLTGLEAGNQQCLVGVPGADHVCDYEEVLKAQIRGDLAGIPAGTTAWVQRTTTAIVNGQPSAPGPGGNCHDWTYPGNHLADGEYLTFDQPGVPTYHLDDDTIWDPTGPDFGDHVIPGDLQCGGQLRSIFCCFPACAMPQGG